MSVPHIEVMIGYVRSGVTGCLDECQPATDGLPSATDELEPEAYPSDSARDRDRPALYRVLLLLGVHAEAIQWHADNPGQSAAFIGE